MSDVPASEAPESWVRNTRLVRHCAATRREVLLHKWYESERAGRDVGWDRAAVDWLIRHGIRRPHTPPEEC